MPLAHLPDLINPLGFGLCLNGKQNDVYDHRGHYDSLFRASFKPGNDDD